MGLSKKKTKKLGDWLEKRAQAIWANLRTNHLWQRMLKNTTATTIAVILALIPSVGRILGKAAYLAPMVTVFGHPGRRFGAMAEALVLAVAGTVVGLAWSTLAVYLSSLVYENNAPAAYTIKGIFIATAVLFHGLLRSHTPRLFIFVLLLVIVSVVSLTSTAVEVTTSLATQLLYPICMATAVLLIVNITIFPEFSSSFLGITTIETLGETIGVLRDAGEYFVAISNLNEGKEIVERVPGLANTITRQRTTLAEKSKIVADVPLSQTISNIFRKSHIKSPVTQDTASKTIKLQALTASKAKLRAKLESCRSAQQECNFELTWAVLPPQDLKTISSTNMKLLVANVVSLIGACESKYALMGDSHDTPGGNRTLNPYWEQLPEEPKDNINSSPGWDVMDSPDELESRRWPRNEDENKRTQKKSKRKTKTEQQANLEDIALVKPRKEIEFGDIELLKYLVSRIAEPLSELQEKIDRSVDVISSSLAYCYDVPELPSGSKAPSGIELDEIDIHISILTEALLVFDTNSASALEGAAAMHDLQHSQLDIMPRMETFLISSFLLNFRQSALHTREILKQSRVIVEKRQQRNGRRTIYTPEIKWRKWLTSGGEEDSLALPERGRKDARTGEKDNDAPNDDSSSGSQPSIVNGSRNDVESGPSNDDHSPKYSLKSKRSRKSMVQKPMSKTLRLRHILADMLEYLVGSEDVAYAIKLTIATLLVTWPALNKNWNGWFSFNRGVWAALQLVLVFEVALGTSIRTFVIRGVGTTLGCVWGYVAYQAGHGNRIVCVIILVIGIIPSTYVQLGSQYVKAGMVSIISMSIVAIATVDDTLSTSATSNFLKRLIAFLIGGFVALVIELIVFPVKARDRLVESLASSINHINEMESCLAHGIETGANIDVNSKEVSNRFTRAKGKAEGALCAAETFLPFCEHEPRLKGSFKGLALIYAEIIYVLHAIVDRMDNMIHLRQEYGSGVHEELNPQVYQYRRNVAGSITLILFAVHEALTTKLPLPQFLPSARLAHLRMVNRVREVVLTRGTTDPNRTDENSRSEIEIMMVKRVLRHKFLSWNAASAGQIEVIEYLEELIDLVKLLVGASEFRSGMLTRPMHQEYVDRIDRGQGMVKPQPEANISTKESVGAVISKGKEIGNRSGLIRRITSFSRTEGAKQEKQQSQDSNQVEEEELPRSLQRVRSRRVEQMNLRLEKSRSMDEHTTRRKQGKEIPGKSQ